MSEKPNMHQRGIQDSNGEIPTVETWRKDDLGPDYHKWTEAALKLEELGYNDQAEALRTANSHRIMANESTDERSRKSAEFVKPLSDEEREKIVDECISRWFTPLFLSDTKIEEFDEDGDQTEEYKAFINRREEEMRIFDSKHPEVIKQIKELVGNRMKQFIYPSEEEGYDSIALANEKHYIEQAVQRASFYFKEPRLLDEAEIRQVEANMERR